MIHCYLSNHGYYHLLCFKCVLNVPCPILPILVLSVMKIYPAFGTFRNSFNVQCMNVINFIFQAKKEEKVKSFNNCVELGVGMCFANTALRNSQ